MPRTLTVVATSYPRSESDWQGLFIRRLCDALSKDSDLAVRLWAPSGPVSPRLEVATTAEDRRFLERLSDRGGIAHLLRAAPIRGTIDAAGLLRRLRSLYRRDDSTVLHINWLQNALPLLGLGRKAVISVLGTDYKLLDIPGMVPAMRKVLATNDCALAPNAPWMRQRLQELFGDLCAVEPVNFGIDEHWFAIRADANATSGRWLAVTRVTEDKIGDLFSWGEGVFARDRSLDLVGPNQGALDIPDWVCFHGPADGEILAGRWFPNAAALVSLSRHSEGRPQVMLEAMAAGLPIVASALPAHASTVCDGVTGFLVEDHPRFEQACRKLSSAAARAEMGAAARERAQRDFGTWRECVGRYKRLYAAL